MDKQGQFLSAVLVMMLALIMIAMFSVYAIILEGNGNVYTSLTSSSISSYMAGQIANQYSNIMPFSSSVNSTFSGMLKNFIAGYYPSYVLADSLLNYTNLTYDYAMPPNVTVPNSVEAYVSVILNNTQSSPTPAPFQQMINVPNTTSFWNYINTTSGYFGQNVEFFYGNGKIIPSWLESYNSSSGRWWVKVGTISASSVTKIYMGFASKTTNLFNTNNVGEAPQLSSTYAEYDDGANVFNFYANFAGTSLNTSKWTVSGITYTVNNGFSATATSAEGYIISKNVAINPATNIIDFYGTNFQTSTNSWTAVGAIDGGETGGTSGAGYGSMIVASWPTSSQTNSWQRSSAGLTTSAAMQTSSAAAVWTVEPVSSTSTNFYINYGGLQTVSADADTYPLYEGLIAAGANGAAYTFSEAVTITWYRVRAYPPNGVMPSVSFGSVA
jgi:hypothetical protein